MPISLKSKEKAKSLLEAIKIGIHTVNNSTHLDPKTKLAFNELHQYSENIIKIGFEKNKLTSYELKTIESELFTYWNESINLDVELFWKEIQNRNLEFKRKNLIKYLLENGRLRSVEQWIGLYNNIEQLSSTGQFSLMLEKNELNKLHELLDKEVEKRFSLVNKCFKKGSIALSNYLKFGESMAFLERCKLTLKYFSEDERNQIINMWKSQKYS